MNIEISITIDVICWVKAPVRRIISANWYFSRLTICQERIKLDMSTHHFTQTYHSFANLEETNWAHNCREHPASGRALSSIPLDCQNSYHCRLSRCNSASLNLSTNQSAESRDGWKVIQWWSCSSYHLLCHSKAPLAVVGCSRIDLKHKKCGPPKIIIYRVECKSARK